MSNPNDWPPHIQQRYGIRRTRLVPSILGVALAAAIAGGLAIAQSHNISKSSSIQLLGFTIDSDTAATVKWELTRDVTGETFCALRAQNIDRIDVGYAVVAIPAGEKRIGMSYTIATESRAVTVEVLGCGPDQKLRVPPANFPPGVTAPDQAPPAVANK